MKAILLTLVVFVLIQFHFQFRKERKVPDIFIPPSKKMTSFTFGYNDFLSSLMWVRVVQDFHICDQNKDRSKYPSPREGMDPVNDVLTRELPQSTCDEGWVFQMLDVISDLSPDFKAVYLDGGVMLSVLVDDRAGAAKILNKGLEYYPEDWKLLYRTAYHELFELQNAESASALLVRAGKRGAPRWVFSLSAKLLTKLGRAEFAKTILETVLQRDRTGMYRDRIKNQLNRVNETLMESYQSQ